MWTIPSARSNDFVQESRQNPTNPAVFTIKASGLVYRNVRHELNIWGEQFDIHGGGQDLQFPHHENERPGDIVYMVIFTWNYRMHNGLGGDNEKMSKSLSNSCGADPLPQPEVVRFITCALIAARPTI
ncbi:MAG: hypothetical protein P0107_08950 [Nitrosomonas sp.]|nr:hypothetical protein [Nitrosomonas sp.]